MVYLTRAFLPLLFAHHPIHFIYMVNRAMLSPVTSHHGFSAPGGSLSHYIHHAKFNCNYVSVFSDLRFVKIALRRMFWDVRS